MKFYKIIPLYIKLYKNRIDVCRLDTGECKSSNALFSNSRILFADIDKAEILLRQIVIELTRESSWFRPSTIVAVQQMEMKNEGLSQIEKRAIYHSCEITALAKKVELIESDYELTNFEVLKILNKKVKK